MKIKFENFNLYAQAPADLTINKKYIFFLHGFTCSSTDWNYIINGIDKNYTPILFDLIGHGKSDSPKELNFYKVDSQIEQLKKITDYFTKEKFILYGYSMGGRLALSFADKYPEKLNALILESSTYGINDETEREERNKQDKELAENIRSNSIDNFVKYWLDKEIFAFLKKLPKEKYDKIFNFKLNNNKIGLVNSLLGFGTGFMPSLFDKLKNINFPVLLITGEDDKKFTKINEEMVNEIPKGTHSIIKDSGHSIHFENPTGLNTAINNFLSDL